MKMWFQGLSKTGRVAVTSTAVLIGLGTVGTLAQPSTPSNANSTQAQVQHAKPAPKITTKTVSAIEHIPYATTNIDDSTLDKGTTKVVTEGVNGTKKTTYVITYKDGTETSRTDPITTVVTQPTNKVVANGTKVPAPSCPNGTYVNTYGNTVCSPYVSNSTPAGASAQCSDGTYSFSQSRRGTCSHHGGVAVWL